MILPSTSSCQTPCEPLDAGPPTVRDIASGGSYTSQQLLGERTEVTIRHGDDVYRLRRTSNGKLILTK